VVMKSIRLRPLTSLAVAGAVLLGGAGAAHAGTSYSNFSTTVAKTNGSGYTSYQTQAKNGAAADLETGTVGGNYEVDARVNGTQGNGTWSRNIGDSYRVSLVGNPNHATESVRIQFSNDLTTPVAVQVTGRWRSN
jgi:hypothetical protein